MATVPVKEVKLMKDGKMVTPVTLIDSVRNLDGSKYAENIYTRTEIDAKVKVLQNAIAEIKTWV